MNLQDRAYREARHRIAQALKGHRVHQGDPMNDTERLRRVEARVRHGRECHEGVTRKGEFQPCDKPAIALRDSREDDAYYPVCAYHARGFCIPLVEPDDAAALVAALRAVLGLADYWATQATDYDEDTEQQIDDGKAILRAITEALG